MMKKKHVWEKEKKKEVVWRKGKKPLLIPRYKSWQNMDRQLLAGEFLWNTDAGIQIDSFACEEKREKKKAHCV